MNWLTYRPLRVGGGWQPRLKILKETCDDRGIIRHFMDAYVTRCHLKTPHAEVKETPIPLKLYWGETRFWEKVVTKDLLFKCKHTHEKKKKNKTGRKKRRKKKKERGQTLLQKSQWYAFILWFSPSPSSYCFFTSTVLGSRSIFPILGSNL